MHMSLLWRPLDEDSKLEMFQTFQTKRWLTMPLISGLHNLHQWDMASSCAVCFFSSIRQPIPGPCRALQSWKDFAELALLRRAMAKIPKHFSWDLEKHQLIFATLVDSFDKNQLKIPVEIPNLPCCLMCHMLSKFPQVRTNSGAITCKDLGAGGQDGSAPEVSRIDSAVMFPNMAPNISSKLMSPKM